MAGPLPEMEPRTVAGQRVRPVPIPDGTIPRTRRQAFGSALSFMNDIVLDRWDMIGEQPEALTEDQFNEIKPEGAPIEFFQGMTRRQAETRAAEFEHAQFDAQFEQYPLTQMGGMAVPFFYDIGTIATLPFGSKNIARASATNSLRQFTLQSAIGAGKVAAASTIAEGALQTKQTGGIDPLVLGLSAAVPFAAVPVFGALGQGGRRALGRVKDLEFTNQTGKLSGGKLSPEQASDIAQAVGSKKPPPVRVTDTVPFVPQRRLSESFQDYPGGRKAWVRDLSAGRGSARDFARNLNLDPEAPAIRDLILTVQDRSAQTSRSPRARNVADRTDFQSALQGNRLPAANIERLREDGLVLPVSSDLVNRTNIKLNGRTLTPDEVAAELGRTSLELSETGEILAKALADPANNRRLLAEFEQDGPGALDRAATRRGIDLDPATNPKASPHRVVAAEVSDSEIIKAIESARLETTDVRPQARTRQPDADGVVPEQAANPERAGPESTAPREPDADDAAQASKIRELGGDPEESETIADAFLAAVTRCGANR